MDETNNQTTETTETTQTNVNTSETGDITNSTTQTTVENLDTTNVSETNNGSIKTFTQDELDSIIQKRLAKEQTKWQEKVKSEKDEAKRLANMSSEERTQREIERLTEELTTFKSQSAKKDLLATTQRELGINNLPIEFAEIIVSDDAETTKKNIDLLTSKWNEALSIAVDNKIKGTPPKKTNLETSGTSLTLEDIKSMTTEQISKNWDEVNKVLSQQKK